MPDEIQKEKPKCDECNGETINFRGSGSDLQFKICTKVGTEEHLTMQQAQEKLADERHRARPSGRFG